MIKKEAGENTSTTSDSPQSGTGHPKLKEGLEATTALMRTSNTGNGFKRKMDIVYPEQNTAPINFDED